MTRPRFPISVGPTAMELGLAWYTAAGWAYLKRIAPDAEQLDESFEAWRQGARAALKDFATQGRRVRKVPVDINAFITWAALHQRSLDSAARAEYVSHLLQSQGGAPAD